MPKHKVVGIAPVVGVDGKTVQPGGVVELDPEVTNIDALVQAGVVAPGDPPKPDPKPDTKPKE